MSNFDPSATIYPPKTHHTYSEPIYESPRRRQRSGKKKPKRIADLSIMKELSAETFSPASLKRSTTLRREFPGLHLEETEEEFDPNELKLLPVLATGRTKGRGAENEMKTQ